MKKCIKGLLFAIGAGIIAVVAFLLGKRSR